MKNAIGTTYSETRAGGTVRQNLVEEGRRLTLRLWMTKRSPFRYFKTSPEIISLAVMLYVWFPLSLRNVEDLLRERGIEISHETVRFWWNRFGPLGAASCGLRRSLPACPYLNRHISIPPPETSMYLARPF